MRFWEYDGVCFSIWICPWSYEFSQVYFFFLLFLILTISIMLRDNLEAVYLQSDDMGGISFTTGKMAHKICFITMNNKYD